MVQFTPAPIKLKNVTLSIGADTFEKQISQALLTPNVSADKWRGMAPGAIYGDADWDWDLTLTVAHDDTAGSLSEYFFLNRGQKVPITLAPKAGGVSYVVNVTIVPAGIGGQVGSWAEGSVTLPVDGEPTRVLASGLPVPVTAAPATGGVAGGTMVAVTGANFGTVTAVHFGTTAVPAADWVQLSPTLVVAKAPAQAAGSKPVKVTNASGQSAAAAPFTYA